MGQDTSKRFADAEILCEMYAQDIITANAWENTYPFHDESSPRWSAYELEASRSAILRRLAETPHI